MPPLSDDEKWILPENLRRQEQEAISRVKRGEDGSDNDFGSYYALLTGKNKEWVKQHAISDENYIASYVRQLRSIAARTQPSVQSILDVGCGHGLLTARIAAGFPEAGVTGIDISESGIKHARETFPGVNFEVAAVDAQTNLGHLFDIVHAREFYPFTRTADADFHRGYIEALARHVAPRGLLVLLLKMTPKSLAGNPEAMGSVLNKLGMSSLEKVVLADFRLFPPLPLSLARPITNLAYGMGKRPLVHFYISRRLSPA